MQCMKTLHCRNPYNSRNQLKRRKTMWQQVLDYQKDIIIHIQMHILDLIFWIRTYKAALVKGMSLDSALLHFNWEIVHALGFNTLPLSWLGGRSCDPPRYLQNKMATWRIIWCIWSNIYVLRAQFYAGLLRSPIVFQKAYPQESVDRMGASDSYTEADSWAI